eukprot:1420260-Rhodomonas_salina.1
MGGFLRVLLQQQHLLGLGAGQRGYSQRIKVGHFPSPSSAVSFVYCIILFECLIISKSTLGMGLCLVKEQHTLQPNRRVELRIGGEGWREGGREGAGGRAGGRA